MSDLNEALIGRSPILARSQFCLHLSVPSTPVWTWSVVCLYVRGKDGTRVLPAVSVLGVMSAVPSA